jgi:chromate transporter
VLHGLKVVAVAVVAQAVWGMARNLCTDATRITVMLIAACIALLQTSAWGQVGVIAAAALAGLLWLNTPPPTTHDALPITLSRRTGAMWLALFLVLLAGLPLLAQFTTRQDVAVIDAFYRTGALVFGGGHVVLPLLQAEVVPTLWVSNDVFLAGYAAAQAMPGPLFTFAAFLGASMQQPPTGWPGGLLCLLAIFAPSFLLVMGAMPFWESLRRSPRTQAALAGVNAAVVGLLLAALYQPVWTSAIFSARDFGLALIALVALMVWKLPPWLVVLGSAGVGWLLSLGPA